MRFIPKFTNTWKMASCIMPTATDPSIPAALSDIVLGLRGLNNYRLKPRRAE